MIFPAFLLFVGILGSQSLQEARVNTMPVYSVAELRGELDTLQHILQAAHASLYTYWTPIQVRRLFARARAEITHPFDIFQFYGTVSALLASIGDGHTLAVPAAAVTKLARGDAPRFPLGVRFLAGRAFVTATSSEEVTLGCELLEINGRALATIRDTLLHHVIADAGIRTSKFAKLGAGFAYYYYLLIARPDSFTVTCRPVDGAASVTARLPALTSTAATAHRRSIPTPPELSIQRMAVRVESTEVTRTDRLVLGTFAYDGDGTAEPSYAQLLDSAFAQIARDSVVDLIVDLRGNDGGADYGPDVFAHLAADSFVFADSITTRVRDLSVLAPYTHLDSAFVRHYAATLAPTGSGIYTVLRDSSPDMQRRAPTPNAYCDRVWVLTDGETFSAAMGLVSLVRHTHRGVLAGEMTGGAYHGYSAGDFAVVTLPLTGLRVVVPLERYVLNPDDRRDRRTGVTPDIPITVTILDLLTGKDVVLRTVQAHIAAARRSH